MHLQELNKNKTHKPLLNMKPDVENAYRITEKLAFPRLVSSRGEKEAIQIIVDEYKNSGYKSIHRESFKTSFYNWIVIRYAFFPLGLSVLILALIASINPWLTLGLTVLNFYLASKLLNLSTSDKIHLLKDNEKNYNTENIYVDLKSKNSRGSIVFMGHWDTKSQTFPTTLRIILILIALVSFTVLMILYLIFTILDLIFHLNNPLVYLTLFYICIAFVIIANLNYFNKTSNNSPGAYDNAAAVGVIIELARFFKKNPVEEIDLIFLNTSSEELNLGGAKDFIQNHKNDFDREKTYFINLDLIGGNDFIRLITSYGIPRKISSKKLHKLILEIGANLGIKVKDLYLPTGAWSDFIPIVEEGFEACWIGSQPGLKLVHTKKDNMDLVTKEGIRNTLLLCIDIVKKINNEFIH